MWGKGKFQLNDQFLGGNVVGVKGVWRNDIEEKIIINIYSPCNLVGERELWKDL